MSATVDPGVSPAREAAEDGDPGMHGAAEAVRALRASLRESDVQGAQKVRWLAPRPPGERDLLSDMAAAEGLSNAVQRLAKFWRRAEVRLERVREIDPLEAEVYERLQVPGESLPIVSVVRRESEQAEWQVVCTNEAQDERFVLWVTTSADAIDDVAWTRAFVERHGAHGELLMDGATGVLGHPDRGWLVHVRGPFVPARWPDVLPGEGGGVLELATALSPAQDERRLQTRWMLQAAEVFLSELRGEAAYCPGLEKLVMPQALAAAAAGRLSADQSFRFWARLEESDGWFHSRGLRQLGLPEVEAPVDLLGDRERTRRLVRWLGASMLDARALPSLGTELVLDDESILLVGGRRGPRRGRSYGRWGAIGLIRTDPAFGRGSRTRMRVPDEIA